MANTELEAERLMTLMVVASRTGQHDAAQQYWRRAVELIKARTPEQVEKMERERGLI
jgi:hypothetical protein